MLPACLWAFGFQSCIWSLWALPWPTHADRARAKSWQPSLPDSITHCSASAEKVSPTGGILECPLPPSPQPAGLPALPSPVCQAELALGLPAEQRFRNPERQRGWLSVTSWEMFWLGSLCLHLLPRLARDDASKPLPAPKIPALPPGPARKCLAH